ncbi:MAG: glycoside hydrolase family 3 C-terminal domain-containing protein [Sedimentisphaerales bacterium]|nr:glycoside hydrolase family 3 C-terminal domain-containing protein [Sedimentisphaerales bacterium]
MKIRIILAICIFLTLIQTGCMPSAEQGKNGLDPVIESKIDAILAKMTPEEKVGQMAQLINDNKEDPEEIKNEIRKGRAGSFLNITNIEIRNSLQKTAVEESRLGIPLIFGYDVIHGMRTVFPVPLAEAASWDLDLMEKTAAIAAKEARAYGIDWTFAPMIDIARDPRWGRIVEGAGEDTYLGSMITRAKVRGFQGDDLSDPETIAACLKHYAAYGASQAGREYSTTEVPERVLRDVYLPPFKAGVEEGTATLMSGFNDLNGVPASGNKYLLTDILRDEWGFDGFVVSDWDSIKQLIAHGLAKDKSHAGIIGSTAGVDMEMHTHCYIENLPELAMNGAVSEDVLDTAVRRILRVKFRLGLFDNPYADPKLQDTNILTPEHREVARQAAKESLVLLKNKNNLLPLDKNIKSIALIGPLANNERALKGTWSGMGRDEDVVTIMQGIKNTVPNCTINYAKGCDITGGDDEGFAEAVKAAEKSDVVIMAIGESEDLNGESHSRTKIDLPGRQKELLKEINKTGKPVVIVLFTGRPLTIDWSLENIPAILLAWHPGIEGGNGIADVLFGDYNPAGKITVTFPRSVGQIPIYYNMKNTGRPFDEEDRFTSKYIDSPNTPLLPFGYGLSYTTFDYKNLKIENEKVAIPGTVKISARVTNTGPVAGHEVVQLYIRDLVGSVTRPVKELKGFERIYLEPGETKTVTFDLSTCDLKFYDINMEYNVEPGNFKVWVGPNSVEGLEGSFELL